MNDFIQLQGSLSASETTEDDLKLIHRFADNSTTMAEFFTLSMTAVNDSPIIKEGVRLIVSPEWMKHHEEKFVGIPFLDSHDSKRKSKLGRVMASEFNQDTNSVTLRAFMGRGVGNDDVIDRIRKGIDLEVPIGFPLIKFEDKTINGVPHIVIVPDPADPKDGPQEISLVGLGAVTGARIAAEADIQLAEIMATPFLTMTDRECLLFGREQKSKLIDDVVSYERQLKLSADSTEAIKSYSGHTPQFLQDRRTSLLKLMGDKEKTDTQISIDFDTLAREAGVEEQYRETMTAQQITKDINRKEK